MQTLPISELIRTVAAADSTAASVPRQPQQATAGQDVGFDIREGVQPGAVTSRLQQRADMWPHLANPFGIDADQLSRGVHKGTCVPPWRNWRA